MISAIFVYRIDWQGTLIEISYEPNWMPRAGSGVAHLQVQRIEPMGAALPISATGYRSRFLPPGDVTDAGGPVEFTRAWLDDAANDCGWKRAIENARQLSFF